MSPRRPMLRRPARATLEWAGLIWDIGVMFLVTLNLVLIVFDTLFVAETFANMVGVVSPAFRSWYADSVHEHFITIDLYFVAVFLFDVLLGWSVAIWQRTYHRWFFYPFVRWYDVLGCIPLAGFRWLRVLRVIALGVRLQRLGMIDVRNWRVYAFLKKYYDILVEEVSDRVVVNVLDGVQEEVHSGGGELSRRVITDVVQPRKQQLVGAVRTRAERAVTRAYESNREEIQGYVANLVDRAVAGNTAIAGLERIPMLGTAVTRSIEWAIRDAVNNVLDEAVAGLDSDEFDTMVQNVADSVFELLLDEEAASDPEVTRAMVEVIDLLKEQVRVQRWKEEYA